MEKLTRKVRGGLQFLRSRLTGNSAILLYHRVAKKERDPFDLCVTPSHFSEQMEAVRRLGTPLPIGEFTRRHRAGTLPKGSLCLSFDDGYVDFVENALPILETFELPAVIYCVSGHPGEPFWWDRILACLHGSAKTPRAIELRHGDDLVAVEPAKIGTDAAFERLYAFFRPLAPEAREAHLKRLEHLTRTSIDDNRPRLMTAAELETLSAHPLITIGAHTESHSSLAGLPPEEQFQEIESSRKFLERTTGGPVTTFSYPFGVRDRDYNRDTIAAAERAGFDHALAADSGVVTGRSDPFALPRLWAHDLEGARFERKLRFWL